MAMELDNLIQKIKQEGVREAKKKAEQIIQEAQEKAKTIIESAEEKKAAIIKEGKREAANLKRNGEEALRQASRDLLLSLRQRIIELFDNIVKSEISQTLSSSNLKEIIAKTIENFKIDEGLNIEILLSKEDKNKLEETLLSSLKGQLKKGITIKSSSGIEKGFRIGQKGKEFYYDFTDDAIAEAFGVYLNPKITEILKIKN